MSEQLTVDLPDDLARQARTLAAATNRRLEDAIIEWIGRAVAEPPVESMTDVALLALCDSTFDECDQERLSDLLSRAGEGSLPAAEQTQLDGLMAAYRRGLVAKASAWREAVARGLRSAPADDHAA